MTPTSMALGVFLAYHPWFTLDEQIELAKLSDEIGLESLWVSEAYGFDAVTVLATLAAHTQSIAVGSAVLQIPARRSTTTAMTAAALSGASHGRFRLGLGVSGPQVSEGWYGVPFGRGLTRTRQYIAQVRAALAGEAVQLPLEAGEATGLGKPIRMLAPEVPSVPIYLGALAPRAIEQCFEIADGWIPFVVDKQLLRDHPAPRDRPFDVAATVPLAIADTLAEAREAVRPWLTFYFGAMGHPKKHFLVELAERYGHGASAREVQRRYLSRNERATAGEALTDELIDAAAIATTAELLPGRMADYADAGATSLIAIPCGDRAATIRAFAAAQRAV